MSLQDALSSLKGQLQGSLLTDKATAVLYSTDASAYRETPLAVACPTGAEDIRKLILFAKAQGLSLIPRAAGTSLAGQVVGKGIVVDISRHMTRILEVNKEEGWVRVQPGVIRDELNLVLKNHGLFFGPETSTANRAMLGGMVGNNSCGSNSIVYGSTREHLLEAKGFLSDGTEAVFKADTPESFAQALKEPGLRGDIYRKTNELLSDGALRHEITEQFPKPQIPRRNTGYALDLLAGTQVFETENPKPFDFCKLIAGSEGTLFFLTELKMKALPLPPKHQYLVCGHFDSIDAALRANLIALKYRPTACELIDNYILECTKQNIEQRQNRFFVQGDPAALLVVELARDTEAEGLEDAKKMEAEMRAAGFGYHFPVVTGEDVKKVWGLRKAGLGLLSNVPGDSKPVPVVEDTAVDVNDLPEYIAEFNLIMKKRGLYCVHYAHAGSGELHLRPILNLKTSEGTLMFRTVAEDIAGLVKKYKGSLSGEHGDGRLRGEFIEFMVGKQCYAAMKEVKKAWDPHNLFNPEKIVDTPSMNSSLRYAPDRVEPEIPTLLSFEALGGPLRAAELCNGSGDCRKTHLSGGTMCPSYMATKNEKDTTRARANILREFLTHSEQSNRFDHREIMESMDLCLSCKGCKSECPSNVDVAKLKAEATYQYYQKNKPSFRARLIANFSGSTALAALAPSVYNFFFSKPFTASIGKSIMGIAAGRSVPLLHKQTLREWFKAHRKNNPAGGVKGKVLLFCDEFTNYHDVPLGITTVKLLEKLGYEVSIPTHIESGRTFISKGFLKEAKQIAHQNISLLAGLVGENAPLVGIEPSAILTLRDEYLDLAEPGMKEAARRLAAHSFLLDEFLDKEAQAGKIGPELFTQEKRRVRLHGHCHQKALSSVVPSKRILSLPKNYEVLLIPSGCCGMAGSFGYEEEHFEVSMQIGELVLFPAVRAEAETTIIAALGTSCRHQIKDGTGRQSLHPAEVLWQALK